MNERSKKLTVFAICEILLGLFGLLVLMGGINIYFRPGQSGEAYWMERTLGGFIILISLPAPFLMFSGISILKFYPKAKKINIILGIVWAVVMAVAIFYYCSKFLF